MEISFKTKKLEKECSTQKEAVRAYGSELAGVLMRRLTQIDAADCLADLPPTKPVRRHPLKGNRSGQFAVDLKYPFRLVFEPDHIPVPRLGDGAVNLAMVTEIRILEVVNYHGD